LKATDNGSKIRREGALVATICYGSFEWDEAKADRNHEKHGVAFEDVANVLTSTSAELHLVEYDDAHSLAEDRYTTLVPHPDDSEILLWVCWTVRDDGEEIRTRLVSARFATEGEEDRYARWRAGEEGRA
jgi:uncharacterized DUF497 family protein